MSPLSGQFWVIQLFGIVIWQFYCLCYGLDKYRSGVLCRIDHIYRDDLINDFQFYGYRSSMTILEMK